MLCRHEWRVIQLGEQSRITNIVDIAKLAPYFFVEPDYGSREAESMVKYIPQADIGMLHPYFQTSLPTLGILLVKILTSVVPRLELVESWTEDELVTVLHDVSHDLGVVQKTFMTVLRHALSGMKVRGTVSMIFPSSHCPVNRLDPGSRKSWKLLEKSGA